MTDEKGNKIKAKNKDSIVCDSVVVIKMYLSLAQNYIENNEGVFNFDPIYMVLEKIQDEIEKIENVYSY